jgi:hypothetical protein
MATSSTSPEHLELLPTDEPVLDLYAQGPYCVPDGLAEQVHERGRELDASAEARSLRGDLPGTSRPA